MDDSGGMRSMVTAFRLSAALSVAAELGLSDALADGPRTVGDLAATVQADEDTLRRLLRVLVAAGVYAEDDGSFANTPMGDELRSGRPGSLRPLARIHQDPAIWSAWGHLGHSVRTGATAFDALHGIDLWTHRKRNPEQNAIFNDTMAALSWYVGDAVANAYDFSGLTTVVDVGGGQGVLLEAVLARHAHLTGTVFDLEHVVPKSSALDSRRSVAVGNFFEEVPAADAYLVKSILHDWPDDRCVRILRNCAAALNPGGAVLVVEVVLGRPGDELEAALSDLNMLVVAGGKERTEAEYAVLFEAAGLRLTRIVETGTPMAIIEARLA